MVVGAIDSFAAILRFSVARQYVAQLTSIAAAKLSGLFAAPALVIAADERAPMQRSPYARLRKHAARAIDIRNAVPGSHVGRISRSKFSPLSFGEASSPFAIADDHKRLSLNFSY
jgi:hypothetical protein